MPHTQKSQIGPPDHRAIANHRLFPYSNGMSATLSNPRAHAGVRSAPHSPAGFSLLELLITLALVFVIATLYFGFSTPHKARSARAACRSNLQKIFLALEIYAQDNAGRFPVVAGADYSREPLALLVPRYSVDLGIFHCPGTGVAPTPEASLRLGKTSYAYYMGQRSGGTPAALLSDAQVNTHSKSAGDPVFSATGKPPGNNHRPVGGNILFSDGRVESSPTNLVFALPVTGGVVLLNPKP